MIVVSSQLQSKVVASKSPDYTSLNDNDYTIVFLLYLILDHIDLTKITPYSFIKYDGVIYRMINTDNSSFAEFAVTYLDSNSDMRWRSFKIKSGANTAMQSINGATPTNISTQKDGISMYFYY